MKLADVVIAMLESGRYKQIAGRLHGIGNERCIVGILCDACDIVYGPYDSSPYVDCEDTPRGREFKAVYNALSDGSSHGNKGFSIECENDEGVTFQEFANRLRSQA